MENADFCPIIVIQEQRIQGIRNAVRLDLHPFRGRKVSKGSVTIRKSRTTLKPGSLVGYDKEILAVHGTHTDRRVSKKTEKPTVSVNVKFEYPTQTGRKKTLP